MRYEVDAKNCETYCVACGGCEKLYGVIFEDEHFFYQEGQRTKHCKYEPTKHCKIWTDRLQAKENIDIPERVVNKLKQCIKRDRIWLDMVTCEMIRGYLKEIKETEFNNNTALLRKLVTGKEPATFTDYELKLVYFYFGKVVQIYNRIKSDTSDNCPYHPFFIYKIVEQILKEERIRRKEILSCIHLQSRETMIDHDRVWEQICYRMPEFEYKPTDLS